MMNCDHFAADLADYLAGNLNRSSAAVMETHLAECGPCREVADLWSRLGSIPEEMPGPRVRSRFHAMLAEQTAPRKMPLAWQIAAAAAIAAVAFLAGRWTMERNAEVAQLRNEVGNMREVVTRAGRSHEGIEAAIPSPDQHGRSRPNGRTAPEERVADGGGGSGR